MMDSRSVTSSAWSAFEIDTLCFKGYSLSLDFSFDLVAVAFMFNMISDKISELI
jgi:hypothetical protein